jgi:hypothetical protein
MCSWEAEVVCGGGLKRVELRNFWTICTGERNDEVKVCTGKK